ncbi:hypothetical protein, partial [Actinoplanes philippinensis]|uniref:hypothetical protein n=1 Tax=Actinoplanes philippinensis TaxID=35752 RepID=UPI0034107ABA
MVGSTRLIETMDEAGLATAVCRSSSPTPPCPRPCTGSGKAFTLDIGDIELPDFALGLKNVAANDMVLLR